MQKYLTKCDRNFVFSLQQELKERGESNPILYEKLIFILREIFVLHNVICLGGDLRKGTDQEIQVRISR